MRSESPLLNFPGLNIPELITAVTDLAESDMAKRVDLGAVMKSLERLIAALAGAIWLIAAARAIGRVILVVAVVAAAFGKGCGLNAMPASNSAAQVHSNKINETERLRHHSQFEIAEAHHPELIEETKQSRPHMKPLASGENSLTVSNGTFDRTRINSGDKTAFPGFRCSKPL